MISPARCSSEQTSRICRSSARARTQSAVAPGLASPGRTSPCIARCAWADAVMRAAEVMMKETSIESHRRKEAPNAARLGRLHARGSRALTPIVASAAPCESAADAQPSCMQVTQSPCIQICVIDPAARLCVGCGRTLDEISRWAWMSPVSAAPSWIRCPRGSRRRTCRSPLLPRERAAAGSGSAEPGPGRLRSASAPVDNTATIDSRAGARRGEFVPVCIG